MMMPDLKVTLVDLTLHRSCTFQLFTEKKSEYFYVMLIQTVMQ